MNENWLIPIAFFTSLISGFTGLGGGALLMGAMGMFFSPSLLIPLHGTVQLVSNLSRAAFSFNDLRRDIIWRYLLGAVLGGGLGFKVVIALPENVLWVTLGVFLLLVTWVRVPQTIPNFPFKYALLGGVSTILSLFVGITGPLVHPVILREGLAKHSFIGTEATCVAITHLIKIAVFTFSGVVLLKYWPLILAMSLGAVAGSYAGKLILNRMRQDVFVWVVRGMVTILAIRMLFKSLV